ncbi:bifunctional 6-phosphofructo-2-kinase/fructose-2,6-bisphosphate 2-phosphatase [Patellaria atrata CBS 101060]|uniref:Bifunctional 6-phosphofructo-2-kinase/fructose-2,6-bisphosphate 2-phosphatase n=1 Tax=Patellaria atrata CBS 101060 TaxID=1346257 RepID=A0A9P4SCT6_9PEZI|nr:bifunctional 6-phosphofructo-2-kinase/fructose-2,6-bisphosphate 2-phosphatase [Patellaria atrata CBS 101060]
MVGLPARGKSYITKKLARYLNWLQHSTEIFNVGERRRIAAGSDTEAMDQSASFFDPSNRKAALIREQVAMETLDEALEFLLVKNGSVSILDATNSTMERRKLLMKRIREKAGPELNVLFVESLCLDEHLLESNMRLKLSGPDYKDKDPIEALEDFKKRVAIYQKNYVPLGEYEEKNNMPYVQMIDVGRKVISHQIHGFLSSQVVYYLLNFNLAPRQIWITRHGESLDNLHGKIGGDSDLSENGRRYAQAMTKFIDSERRIWEMRQVDKANHTHFPPHPGDHTPPNPHYYCQDGEDVPTKNFCVWTSMLKRSIQSAEYFDDEDYEVKQMKMLDELYAGAMEGMTYDEIRNKHADEFELRKTDKLAYRYPGPGGEGYLDVVNRLRPVIIELERMTDHVLLITHRSVARILLAYFQGLRRDQVADLDCPLGMLYSLEPKPYGVEFRAYRYNSETAWM